MAHRFVEMLIGRLITDEDFRLRFLARPEATLVTLCELGIELSRAEMSALLQTDPALWTRTAEAIDPRLQKVSLAERSECSASDPRSYSSPYFRSRT